MNEGWFAAEETVTIIQVLKGAARGGEGAQAPPLSNQNIDVYFLSYSPTL